MAGYWPPWTDVTPPSPAFVAAVKTVALDQMTPPAGTLVMNGQRESNLGDPVLAQDAVPAKMSYGGWVTDAAAWTRTSNTTFTQTGDTTAYMKAGLTKLRWQESAVQKYGVVASAVFATGTTTVTLAPTSDYVMAASPDANTNQYTYGKPIDFPTAFNWSPVFTGFSAAPGALSAWWTVADGYVEVGYTAFTSGTSNAATMTITNLPFTVNGNKTANVLCLVQDNGTFVTGNVSATQGGTVATFGKAAAGAGGFTASGSKTATFTIRYAI